MPEPTEGQKKFFTDNNLILPPTRDAARSLQDFVERGNTQKNTEQTCDERIMFLRAMQEVWIGQRVVHQMRQDGKKEFVHLKAMINRAGQMVSIGLERLCLLETEAKEAERAASL